MSRSQVLDLLLAFAASMDEQHFTEWNMLVMEIFYHLFMHRNPKALAMNKVFQEYPLIFYCNQKI